MAQPCCGEGNFRLSVLPVILQLYSFCKGKTVQNSSDPAPTWVNIFSSSDQLVNRLIRALLATPADSRKPELVQPSPKPMTVVYPDQGDSPTQYKDISTCSFIHTELASTCFLGFSQQPRLKLASENVIFCRYWQSHTFPKCCTHGSRQKHRQIRQLLMTAGCSRWPKARKQRPVQPVRKNKARLNPVRS